MGALMVIDDCMPRPAAVGPLSTATAEGPPQLLQVSDGAGVLATLTVGSRTVTMRGAPRTFVENKRPFTDAFSRTSSSGFGQSPGGGNWSNSGGTSAAYTVNGSVGVITCETANNSRHASIVDTVTDVDVTVKVAITAAPTGASSSIALVVGYTTADNQTRARLLVTTAGVVQLALEKEVAGSTTSLGALTQVGTGYTAGQWWRIRAQRVGTTVRCRAWKDGDAEPGTWLHSTTDTDNASGRVGLRAIAATGSTNLPRVFQVDDMQVVSGTWPSPPTVTHDTWVRILTTPFDGTWTPALEAQVRAWAVDTTPDVLAYAMMYITGAPAVTSSTMSGAQIAGQSKYGPPDADGVPAEGADFHDYMGLPWTFPNGETQSAAGDELGCLDCSGFLRMVWGFHMGIPMVRTANIDGTVLPRVTKDIGPSGPGIVVVQATDTVPSMAAMRIGDIPCFDADSSDPVAGQIDHAGIYLGVDSAGHPRFINSRKTPNGPTFADLGGSSALDGAGLYATSLRLIRRF